MAIGYVALVLHAHLPFVRHPESDYVLEEEWLYEAITETYIPLLKVFEGLKRDGIDFKITMSMTPPLVSMLRDPLLQERYEAHLAHLRRPYLLGRFLISTKDSNTSFCINWGISAKAGTRTGIKDAMPISEEVA